MGKKIYISGNTINGFDSFSLICTKDFENKIFTNDSSLVDNEEYFYADFKSVESIESCYENIIIKWQDKVSDLQAKLKDLQNLLDKNCFKDITQLEDVFNYNLNQVAYLSKENVNLKNDISKRNGEILELKLQIKESNAYKLRIELAGAEEEIARLRDENKMIKNKILKEE